MNKQLEKGIIFDIKQFSLFDGIGLRQTVFLKGCPLKCSWCQNPEGKLFKPQLMVGYASCLHCDACKRVCPSPDNCTLCGKCIEVCPVNIRKICGKEYSSAELETLIRKDADYYEKLGGGTTFSGGEPLSQPKFLSETLSRIPDLNTCIETSGYTSNSVFQEIYDKLSFIIMDLKIMDPLIHKKYVGVDNKIILQNARFLTQGKKPFIIRIPVIPGVNDNDQNYLKTAEFLKGSKNLIKVELLPYQKAAGAKYPMVNEYYNPSFDTEKEVYINQEIFSERGIRSSIL